MMIGHKRLYNTSALMLEKLFRKIFESTAFYVLVKFLNGTYFKHTPRIIKIFILFMEILVVLHVTIKLRTTV